MSLPRIGAHLSSSGGAEKVLARAREIGADAVQLFSSNPRQWPSARTDADGPRRLGEALRRAGLPLFVHSIYLINLASPDPELRRKSSSALADALLFAQITGAAGVVTHLGSRRGGPAESGVERVVGSVREAYRTLAVAAARRPERVHRPGPALLLEVSAGSGETVGGTLDELCLLHSLLRGVSPDAGLCLDTAHLLAGGYPVHTELGVRSVLQEIDERTGLEALRLVHLNDSKSALGSHSDRHENLWEGTLGRDGVAHWVGNPRLQQVPFVLEVPGFDAKGPDRENLRRAKVLRRRVRRTPNSSGTSDSY